MQVDFLVRALAVVVAGHVTGNHHHRHRIERGVGDAGGRIGQSGAKVAEYNRRCLLGTGIAVCRMSRDLFVAGVDEFDGAFFQRCEHGDIGVTAQAEDVLNTAVFQVFDQLVGNQLFHCCLRWWWVASWLVKAGNDQQSLDWR